jgi:hypothetical protein
MTDTVLLPASPTALRLESRPSLWTTSLATLPLLAVASLTPEAPATHLHRHRVEGQPTVERGGSPLWAGSAASLSVDAGEERREECALLQRVLEVLHEQAPSSLPPSLTRATHSDLRAASAQDFRALRTRILDELEDFEAWVAVMRALQPKADSLEVPERFIGVAAPLDTDADLLADLDAAAEVQRLYEEG